MRLTTIALIIAILGAGFGVLQVLRTLAPEAPVAQKREPVVSVSVVSAKIASHQPLVSVIGTIEAKNATTLTSPLETEVLEVLVQEGERVAKGTQLVRLDTRETSYQLEAQQARLDDVSAQIDALRLDVVSEQRRLDEIRKLVRLAEDELRRSEMLFERGVVAESAVDQARGALSARELEEIGQQKAINGLDLMGKRLDASVRTARAEINQLRLVLERSATTAPFDAIVTVVHPSVGSRVPRSAALIELYDPATIRLRAAIPNAYATAGQAAGLEGRISSPGTAGRLALINISPESKPGRGTVDALFSLPGDNWLLGAAVEFDLLLPPTDAAVAVPFDALYNGSRIYVVDPELRAQAIVCENSGQTLVDGVSQALLRCPQLANGDKVVINRIPNLVSGTKLQIVSS